MVRSNLYISDNHFGHANIIKFAGRPFDSVFYMNQIMWNHLYSAAQRGRIVYAGDLCLDSRKLPDYELPNAERHILVMGNHDPEEPRDVLKYTRWFGTIHGTRKTWRTHGHIIQDWLDRRNVRVLVSHEPQPHQPDFWDINVYGHHHNNLIRRPDDYGEGGQWGDYRWLRGSPRHFNACAEIVDYIPRTLDELSELGVWR